MIAPCHFENQMTAAELSHRQHVSARFLRDIPTEAIEAASQLADAKARLLLLVGYVMGAESHD